MNRTICNILIVSITLFITTIYKDFSYGREALPLNEIRLPDSFEIDIYSDKVPNARAMALSPKGILFVGSRNTGKIYAVIDDNRDYRADKVITIATGLSMPTGLDFYRGSLYVAEVNRIIEFEEIEERLQNPGEPVIVNDSFPNIKWHGWKYIRFSPDGKLYVPVGAPCNVCERDYEDFANIKRMNPDGSGLELYAKGVRNTVGFDWHPQTKELWFTDNGRDMLGDDLPPDELNHAPSSGMHFGFPYCHGGEIRDPEFGQKHDCTEFTPPAMKLGPHVASLGMRFYTGNMFPEEYQNQIFIAEHGSWNRSKKIGYRISLVRLKNNQAVSYETFAEGWLKDENAWGRPVDVLVMPDGSMLISDDKAGAIFRIIYKQK